MKELKAMMRQILEELHEERLQMPKKTMNGSTKLVYWLLAVQFALLTGTGGVIWKSLANTVDEVRSEQMRRTSRISTLEERMDRSREEDKELKQMLNDLRTEVKSVQLQLLSVGRPK